MVMNKKLILEKFLKNDYEQIVCEQCLTTFLTNVYDYDRQHVLLEKRSLGLEYFCNAISNYPLTHIPKISRIAVLNEEDQQLEISLTQELFQQQETDYRYLYIMERLLHLEKEEAYFFEHNTQDLELFPDRNKQKAFDNIQARYGLNLVSDIMNLCAYYRKNEAFIAWDLHADNLMKREKTGEIVILDPYAVKV
jgi:hypothetical protein